MISCLFLWCCLQNFHKTTTWNRHISSAYLRERELCDGQFFKFFCRILKPSYIFCLRLLTLYTETNSMNRPFPSSLVPLFQTESKCETFLMKMSSACSFIFMQIKVIFIRMVSHLDSLCNRGIRDLGNGLFNFSRDS